MSYVKTFIFIAALFFCIWVVVGLTVGHAVLASLGAGAFITAMKGFAHNIEDFLMDLFDK